MIIRIVQTNIIVTIAKEFPIIKKALTSDIFFEIIYTTVPKLLIITSSMVWILDSSTTRL